MANRAVHVDTRTLADLDEARDYDAVSSYNFLNAELRRLRETAAAGGAVVIESEAGRFARRTVGEVSAWARGRYLDAGRI